MRALMPVAAQAAPSSPFVDTRPIARVDPAGNACLSTGHEELDRGLPGAGWPLARLTELLVADTGLAELPALAPVLTLLTRSGRTVLLLNPPDAGLIELLARHGVARSRLLLIGGSRPAEQLWAVEQATARDDFGALIAWMPAHMQDESMHRLDRAVRQSAGFGIVLRPIAGARDITPAALRVIMQADTDERMQITTLARTSRRIEPARTITLRSSIVMRRPGAARAGAPAMSQMPPAAPLQTSAPVIPWRQRVRTPWPRVKGQTDSGQ